jgi:glutamate-1-semialdehyde 2,1-aminomutase
MGTVFFHAGEVGDYAEATRSDTAAYARWFRAMLERGVYLPPSQFEAWFVSTAHDDAALDLVIGVAREAARAAKG